MDWGIKVWGGGGIIRGVKVMWREGLNYKELRGGA